MRGKASASIGDVFQSTPPREGATVGDGAPRPLGCVSIHAPARGGDDHSRFRVFHRTRFNPRPRARGRPATKHIEPISRHVSIHAPARGGDLGLSGFKNLVVEFQSTPPREGATLLSLKKDFGVLVSIHAPARGGDLKVGGDCGKASQCFNPRPRARGRLTPSWLWRPHSDGFNPRPRARGRHQIERVLRGG